jgi:hypothetical protein
LRDYEDLLDAQGADGFRVRAYRRGAPTLWRISINLSAEILARKGRDGLVALPSIGAGIAGVIAEISATGRWSQLERLRGELAPEILFRTIPGIGPQMDNLRPLRTWKRHLNMVNLSTKVLASVARQCLPPCSPKDSAVRCLRVAWKRRHLPLFRGSCT